MDFAANTYTLTISCCVFITVVSAFLMAIKLFKKKISEQKTIIEQQNDAFSRWIQLTEKRLKRQKIIRGRLYIFLLIALSIFAFFGALIMFHNLPAAMFVTLTILLIPGRILQISEEKERMKLTEQLITAIRLFAAEFIQTPHLEKGFAAIAARVPPPTGTIFADAYKDLVIGIDPEMVLANLSAKLETEHGKMFVQLLRQARIDMSISTLFPKLLEKVEKHLDLLRKNASGLLGERILTVLTAAAPIPIYFIMRGLLPEVDEFFIRTVVGRVLLAAVFLSMFLWAIIDRIAGRVQA